MKPACLPLRLITLVDSSEPKVRSLSDLPNKLSMLATPLLTLLVMTLPFADIVVLVDSVDLLEPEPS